MDSECRVFQEKWESKYFCFYEWEILCLICRNESPVLSKEYNTARYYNSKHDERYKNYVSGIRGEKVADRRRELESQENVCRKQSSDGSSALWESYRVARLLAKEANLFPMGNS